MCQSVGSDLWAAAWPWPQATGRSLWPKRIAQSNGRAGGPGGLTKEGLGDLRLFGTSSNTFGGPIVVHDGQLVLAKSSGLVAVPGPLIIGNGVSNGMVRLANANQIADGAAVTIITSGELDLNNRAGLC